MVKNQYHFFASASLVVLAMLFACQPTEKQLLIENSSKFLPSEEERKHVIQKVEEDNDKFDPVYNALKIYTPGSANHYHSTRVGIDNHPTRSAAHYAVQLLETGIPEYQERAMKVIEAVLAVQDVNPENDTYGIWPYHFEEPLPQMNRPDWNWADFISVQLLEAYLQHQDVIPVDLLKRMEESIIHASYSIKKRDVKPGYTNIAIMGTLVTHLAGHLFDNQELKDYADMRMKRFYDYTKKLGGFVEYNSPTYTRVALDELVRMKQYLLDPATLEMVDFCYYTGWKVLSSHFHAPTGRLAGPHSRSYSTLHRASFFDFLYGASDGKVKVDEAKKPLNYYKLQHKIPLDLLANFLETQENRIQVDTFSLNENPPVGYTFITPEYSFGSVNRCTTWKQRRPYIAYWGQQGNVKFLRVKLMHDDEDFGIGNIFTVQNENESLSAMNFATNGGDYHISIDRIKDAKFVARDVRLRFEMASEETVEKINLNKNGFSLKDEEIQVDINMLKSVFGKQNIEVNKGGQDDLAWVDYIIYKGEEKEFDLTEIDKACFAWQTVFRPENKSKAELIETDNHVEIRSGKMSLSIPVKPALENVLQNAFVSKGSG
jgi:hypothetical protein